MTNRIILFVLFLIASATLVLAQQSAPITYTVKGILVDSLTMEPEPYATIRIVNKASPQKPAKMAVTDTKGQFQEKLTTSGDFILTISSIGKTTVTKEFTLKAGNTTVDFGTLYTSDAANELGVVEVVAQKPLVKVDLDKIEYNIEDDPDSQTNSVLEMLRKVPLVTVDGEDKIQVNGSSNFKVYVNGKPNNMMSDNPTEVLKSMPANSIKNIEVITNPGPKYDAEGVGGILNIVTIGGSGFAGYTATFSGNVSNMGAGGSVYTTIQHKKLTLTGNYSINHIESPRSYTGRTNERTEDNTVEISNGWNKNKRLFQHGNVEASYEIDTLRLISLSFGLHGSSNDNDSETETEKFDLNSSTKVPVYQYNQFTNGEGSWFSIRGGLDYQRSFKVKDRMLTFSYRLNTRPNTSDNYNRYEIGFINDESDLSRLRDHHRDGAQSTTEHTFQGDYVTPIGKYHSIETGVKYIIRNSKSDDDYYNLAGNTEILDEQRTSHYRHLNDILGVYGGYSLKYKSIMGKVGLRYERTMQDVEYNDTSKDDFSANFNDVVPSASVGLKLGETKNLRLNYNMRIWRPNIFYLNPYLDDTNPTRVSQGNPELESEKNHSFQLSFSSFTQKFNINASLRYSFTNNSIEEITRLVHPSEIPGWRNPITAGEEVLYSTYDNIGKTTTTGMNLYINWNASPKTRIYMNASGSYNTYDARTDIDGNKLKNNGWYGYAYGGIQHTFPLDIRLSLNLSGGSPWNSLQNRESGYYYYGLNANKAFLNKRLTLSAFVNFPFSKYRDYDSQITGDGFIQRSDYRFAARRFSVSISYRIGELRAQVKKAARAASNDDVKSGGEGGGGGGGGQ